MRISLQKLWTVLPPWILIGAALLLLPIFTFMAASHISRQRAVSTRLLVEKGAALIRAFEAGTRTGMMGMPQGGFRLQRLLSETAQLPDIVYLYVTDAKGLVLAHSEPANIGSTMPADVDYAAVSRSPETRWREVTLADGSAVFEVYRRFEPTGPGRMPPHHRPGRFPFHRLPDEMETHMGDRPLDTVIFVGLSMETIEATQKADARHTVLMATILLLIGFSGTILLFLGQRYREARSSLSRVQALSDTVLANMPIGLVAVDPQGVIATVNPAAANLLGRRPDACIGRDATGILPTEMVQLIGELREKEVIPDAEIDCRLPPDRHLPLQISGKTMREAPEAPVLGYALLFKDLSELHALRREIVRNQRLAAVGRLAGGVAHEIRNPLSSIKGFAVYFKERYAAVPQDLEMAEIMVQEVDRLNRVVSQLLDFSRPLKLVREAIDLKALVLDALKLVAHPVSEKKIRVETRFPGTLPLVAIDADRFTQVLLNLFINAIDAMESGGRLSVSVQGDPGAAGVRVSIADSGHGIAPEHLSQVFDPYFTTKPSGTGLGLAIVHNIVEAHGGKLHIHSRPGAGTTVTIALSASSPLPDRGPMDSPTSPTEGAHS